MHKESEEVEGYERPSPKMLLVFLALVVIAVMLARYAVPCPGTIQ